MENILLSTEHYIDIELKEFIEKNYIENFEDAKQLLIKAEIMYPATIIDIYGALKEIIKVYDCKTSLTDHLKLIGDLTIVGVNASIAGKKLGEALRKLPPKQIKWWWGKSNKEKHTITVLLLGCKISYKRVNTNQICRLYKEFTKPKFNRSYH